jgi:hypothetical protein
MREFVRRYGAHPLHLLLLVACFALAGYAALKLVHARPVMVIIWFVGAAVAHDIVLVPFYAFIDRSWRRRGTLPRVPWLNYAISGLLLLVFLPEIARLSDRYSATTGLDADGYLGRWLAVTGVLFLVSAALYARRLRRSR